MEKFGSVELKLNKPVKKGDQENLLSLFSADDRFEHIEILSDAEEDDLVHVSLQGLGEIDLKVGADMEKGRKKTIMTLFAYSERSKGIEMQRDAEPGENILITLLK